ncbi:MAG TPA: hypothetical protein VMZ25_01295 [Terriglobales bacterium]|nr:hypothetical protein [Terriglobales bacterium]
MGLVLSFVALLGAAKPKVVNFGRWLTVKWLVGAQEEKTLDLKVRPLLVNGEVKFFSTGESHDITQGLFAVREAHRLNDMLPSDSTPRWKWQPGGWMLVSRPTAKISKLNLPEFDSFYSEAMWYRDFVAYCGVTDGEKLYAMVVQVGRRKPVVKKLLGPAKLGELPNSECSTPEWLRQPMRVVFQPAGGQKIIFNVRGQSVEIQSDGAEEEEP